jgi:hypothetical protein
MKLGRVGGVLSLLGAVGLGACHDAARHDDASPPSATVTAPSSAWASGSAASPTAAASVRGAPSGSGGAALGPLADDDTAAVPDSAAPAHEPLEPGGESASRPSGTAIAGCSAPGKGTLDAVEVVRALGTRDVSTRQFQQSAIETVRLRLRELLAKGCAAKGSDADLTATLFPPLGPTAGLPEVLKGTQVRRPKGLPDLTLAWGSEDRSSWLALYRQEPDTLRTAIALIDQGPAMEQQLMLFDAAVFQPTGATEPMLAVANSHPWVSSCWRDLTFRVLAVGSSPTAPRTLFSKVIGGRVCEDVTVQVNGDVVRFDYLGWAQRFTGDVMRPAALELRYAAGQFEQRYGFVGQPKYVVEDWLALPWALAAQATLPEAASRLEPVHKRLSALKAPSESRYSAEQFPSAGGGRRVAVYCDRGEKQPCSEWPKTVDFELVQRDKHWLLSEVKER